MDKIGEVLNRLGIKEKQKLKSIFLQIERDNSQNLDLKKLKGRKDVFRIRKDDMRIIVYKIDDSIKILSIEYRSSKAYKKMLV